MNYVDWFNHRRLFETCADIPPAELEQARYRQNADITAGQLTTNRVSGVAGAIQLPFMPVS